MKPKQRMRNELRAGLVTIPALRKEANIAKKRLKLEREMVEASEALQTAKRRWRKLQHSYDALITDDTIGLDDYLADIGSVSNPSEIKAHFRGLSAWVDAWDSSRVELTALADDLANGEDE